MLDPGDVKRPIYTQGEHEILLAIEILKREMARGQTRFDDHEKRLRSLERRFWMAMGGGTGLLLTLEVLAFVGVTR